MISRLVRFLRPTLRYWMETEVHVYAFSIAANVVLSFYPFLLVMVSIFHNVLRWNSAIDAIFLGMDDFFPGYFADFMRRNLTAPRRIEWLSILLLLFAANGVFEPLEVALNRIWGIPKNRSFLRNQLISYGLIFVCGMLALLSVASAALNQEFVYNLLGSHETIAAFISTVLFKIAAIPLLMVAMFLVYWVLPNGRVPLNRTILAAIAVGLLLEFLKYAGILLAPWLYDKLHREYNVFVNSVTIILYSFFASMLFLAGAEWASRPVRAQALESAPDSELLPRAPGALR